MDGTGRPPPRDGGEDADPRAGALGPAQARAIAEALARRHATGKPTPDHGPTPGARRGELDSLASALEPLPSDEAAWLERRLTRARAFLLERADLLLLRAGHGRIRAQALLLSLADVRFEADGTATLQPSPDRRPVSEDTALEVASLCVSLVHAQRADLAERLLSHYAGLTEDFELYRVLDLHETSALLRELARRAPEEAARFAQRVAAGWASPPTPRTPPFVLAMSGPVASGKSTLATALADELAAPRVVADRIRDHLVHGAPSRPIHEAGWASGFEPGFGPRVYGELLRHAEMVLETGRAVVLDACFPTPVERAAARALALRHGLPFHFVECFVSREVQRRRLRERGAGAVGDDWEAIALALSESSVPALELPEAERWRVDTSGEPAEALARVLPALVRALRRAPGGARTERV